MALALRKPGSADPVTDAISSDLKCFREEGYRRLGGRLAGLDAIRRWHGEGKWVR